MNFLKLVLLTISIFFCLLNINKAQNLLSTNGKAIVNENQDTVLLRGMGLGGWMIQEGYMLQTAGFANSQHKIKAKIEEFIGKDDTQLFYDAWLDNHTTKQDIDSLKAWGFNSVRLPMHYNLFTLPIEDEPIAGEHTWVDRGFELTDNLIEWCAANEMYVILDLHAAPGGQGYDEAISDYDPSKPSLWESQANRDKMVALWARIAERYADEQWIAGYDILNEPNWNLPGGAAMRLLYRDVTEAIRAVDQDHIIFIEGNWFANDFTGLTPPWDDNLVYSPHKYWSTNDATTMQWVIDLRNTYNVPLYLGETGENSNVWFRDVIRLMEDLQIGWAMWPSKKIESISGLMSINKSDNYTRLLDYWNGNGVKPAESFAKATLMQLTEDIKIENCKIQKDVIDAMFRQVYSDETLPFANLEIPGVIPATDYDLGVIGEAYYDVESGNYQVSTGEFTTWNNGWIYRNDGIDIERSSDNINSNGYSIGWLDNDEWMQYAVNVESSGVYDILVRAASGGSGGRLHFSMDGADITTTQFIAPTGGWQAWTTTIIPDVIINDTDEKLRCHVDFAGFNLSSFEFIKKGELTADLATEFMAAITLDEGTVQMNANKNFALPFPSNNPGFEIFVGNDLIPITSVKVDTDNPRKLIFEVDYILKSTEKIWINYEGTDVLSNDGIALGNFVRKPVINTLDFVHQIPGRIKAEDFTEQNGLSLESSSDTGGGNNLAYLDAGDYALYEVYNPVAGTYDIDYRVSSLNSIGALDLEFVDKDGKVILIDQPEFQATGGWQNWRTVSTKATLPEGRFTMRFNIKKAPFNINWISFSQSTAVFETENSFSIETYPNPTEDFVNVKGEFDNAQSGQVLIYDLKGLLITSKTFIDALQVLESVNIGGYNEGIYLIKVELDNGQHYSQLIHKVSK